uniref:Putative microvillar protein with insect allergen related repeat n=1 Tax=Nyssomyia neivai TaxID=330878 RepID=A0A1L8DR92_9DIPT
MKVLICLSLCVAATVALHLPLGIRDHHLEDDHDVTINRPVPPNWQPPNTPELPISPEFRELMRDIRDFVKLLPRREIRRLLKDAFKHDEEFRTTIRYLRSRQFMNIMMEINELPEVKELIQYVMEQQFEGQDLVMRALSAFEDEIEMETPIEPQTTVTGGFCGLLSRIIDILPTEALRALHREKVANGGVFAKMVRIVTSDDYMQRLFAILEAERFIELNNVLKENGVCISKIGMLHVKILGFH